MNPTPEDIGPGLIELDRQLPDLVREITQYTDSAVQLVTTYETKRTGKENEFTAQPQGFIVDGSCTHPIVTVTHPDNESQITYAVGGAGFKDVYLVQPSRHSPNILTVNWGDGNKEYDRDIPDSYSYVSLQKDRIMLHDHAQYSYNFVLKPDQLDKLTQTEVTDIRDKVAILKLLVKGLHKASDQPVSPPQPNN